MSAPVLLVVGIHREERAFGQAVAAGLAGGLVDVLDIDDGLSGRRPRQDQRFQYDTLHRALYLQLPPQMGPSRRLLIDLHTGLDPDGPCADLYCRNLAFLRLRLAQSAAPNSAPRLISLGGKGDAPGAATVIPREVWDNHHFCYVGMEIYLRQAGAGSPDEQAYACALVRALAG